MNARRYDAVLFDLLTAVLDSWTLWADVAGDPRAARRWRERYLALTFSTGRYVPYESLVARAAAAEGLDPAAAQRLTRAYGQLRPWPEAPRVLTAIAAAMPIGTVTNCSDELGRQAAELVGVPFEVTVTAQSAGAYKPQPEPYRQALDALRRREQTTASARPYLHTPCPKPADLTHIMQLSAFTYLEP